MNHDDLKKTVAAALPGNTLRIAHKDDAGRGVMMKFPDKEPMAKPLCERLAFAWNFIRGIGDADFAAYRIFVINPEWTREKRAYAAAARLLADQVDLPAGPWQADVVEHPDDGRIVTHAVSKPASADGPRETYALVVDPAIADFLAAQRTLGPGLAEAVVYLTHENERLAKLLVEATNKANAKKGGR